MDADLNVTIIAAVARNGVIGKDGKLPWKLQSDLRRFRKITDGKTVVAGRKTHESIVAQLGHPLPDRITLVLTKDKSYLGPGVIIAHSWEQLLSATEHSGEEIIIIGGAEIYRLALPLARTMYITRVEAEIDGDTSFPAWNPAGWTLTESEFHPADTNNQYPFTFETWKRLDI